MSSDLTVYQCLRNQPMHTVWRYLWTALCSGLAIGWYAYSEISSAPILAMERLGKLVQAGTTFGVFFGLVVLLAAEIPERLRQVWARGVCLLLSIALGFIAGTLLWSAYSVVFLSLPVDFDDLGSVVVGGIFTALAFSLGVLYRIAGWLAALWSAVMIYLALFITWSNDMSLIYTRPATPAVPESVFGPAVAAQSAEHINQYALVIALLIGFGAYAPRVFAEVRRLLRHLISETIHTVSY